MLLLKVPFHEKEEVKALGGRWNPQLKSWYAPNRIEYPRFAKWFLHNKASGILCEHLYLVLGVHTCFKCGMPTRVMGFGLGHYYEISIHEAEDGKDTYRFNYFKDEVTIVGDFEPLSSIFLQYLRDNYGFYLDYSKTTKTRYLVNHCQKCNSIQGYYFVFQEVKSPFFINSIEKAKALQLIKIPIEYDIIFESSIGWATYNNLILPNATIIEADFILKSS